MLIAVVGHGITVCGELYVFIIVEVNDIRTRAYGQVTGLIGHSGVSIYSYRSLVGNSITEGLIAHYLGIGDLIRRAVPIVVDGVAQVGARRPRAGQCDGLSGHLEGAVGDGSVICAPAAEGIAVKHRSGSNTNRGVLLVRSGCRRIGCAGRHFARISIAHVIAGNNALDAGDLKVKRLLAAVFICVGKIGLSVCGIVLSFLKSLSGGVELYCIAYRVCICSGVAVSRNNRITEGPLICIFHADILVGSRHIDILTGRVGNLEAGGETAGDLLGYCLKGFVEFRSIVGVISVGLILACRSCYGVAEESSDRGAVAAVGFARAQKSPLMNTAFFPAQLVCNTKADSVYICKRSDLGSACCSSIVGIRTAVVAVRLYAVSIECGLAVGEGNNIL